MSSISCLGRLAAAICRPHWQQQAVGLAVAASQVQDLSHSFSSSIQRSLHGYDGQEVTQHSCWDNAWQGSCHSSNLDNTLSSSSTPVQLTTAFTRHFHSCSSSWHNSSDDSQATTGSGSSSSTESNSSGRGKDMAIVFTCVKCDTRSVKAFSRHSYEKGLVLIRCPGCQSLHLIADHLGWFGVTSFKIDEHMAAQGQQVKRMSLDPAQQQQQQADGAEEQHLAAEDVAGWSKVQQLLTTVATSGGAAGGDAHEGSSSSSSGSSSGTGCGGRQAAGQAQPQVPARAQADSAGQAAADSGVVQVAPEDVQAWVRVQQQRQQ